MCQHPFGIFKVRVPRVGIVLMIRLLPNLEKPVILMVSRLLVFGMLKVGDFILLTGVKLVPIAQRVRKVTGMDRMFTTFHHWHN